ncbi:hypothetical protein ES702_00529 [subsurface metagenome]
MDMLGNGNYHMLGALLCAGVGVGVGNGVDVMICYAFRVHIFNCSCYDVLCTS